MNGKGDKLRKGANLELYRQNYDEIFNKDKTNSHREQSETNSDSTDDSAESSAILSDTHSDGLQDSN